MNLLALLCLPRLLGIAKSWGIRTSWFVRTLNQDQILIYFGVFFVGKRPSSVFVNYIKYLKASMFENLKWPDSLGAAPWDLTYLKNIIAKYFPMIIMKKVTQDIHQVASCLRWCSALKEADLLTVGTSNIKSGHSYKSQHARFKCMAGKPRSVNRIFYRST